MDSDQKILEQASNNNNQPTQDGAPQPQQPEAKKETSKPIIIGAIIAALVVLAGVSFWLMKPAAKPAANQVVKLGLMVPIQGDNISYGTAMKQGVELALKEFNHEGVTIQIVTKVTNCDEESGKAAALELMTKDKVAAIIGEMCSAATLAAAPLANQYHIPIVSPASTNPDVTTAGDYIFRTIPSDAFQGKYAAELLQKQKVKRLALIYSKEIYGTDLADSIEENFKALGGEVVAKEGIEDQSTDVDETIKTVKAANPEAIYIVVLSRTTGVALVLEAKKLGVTAQLYATESMKDPAFLSDTGTSAEGMIVDSVSDGTESFSAKYQAAYGQASNSYSAQSYDAFNAVADTLKKGALTGEQIKTALYKVSFEGVSGPISFDKNGDVPSNYNAFVIKDQKYTLMTP